MNKQIATILIISTLILCNCSGSNTNEHLLQSLQVIFTDHDTKEKTNSLLSKGEWSSDKTVFVLSDSTGTNKVVYAFIKENRNQFLSINLWEFSNNDMDYQLGRKINYYDRYEITPRLWEDIKKDKKIKIGVSIIRHAWKDGQRYSVESKPVLINKDGSLDWSQF